MVWAMSHISRRQYANKASMANRSPQAILAENSLSRFVVTGWANHVLRQQASAKVAGRPQIMAVRGRCIRLA